MVNLAVTVSYSDGVDIWMMRTIRINAGGLWIASQVARRAGVQCPKAALIGIALRR